jgi:arylsulfatase A-like enzyme
VAHVMDIPATILDAASVSHPVAGGTDIAPLQGKSLPSVLADRAAEVRGPSDWIGRELFGNRAVRMDDWKLVPLRAP